MTHDGRHDYTVFDEPDGPDPVIAAMLRSLADDVPVPATLHARVMAAARPLVRRRRPRALAWWQVTAGWARAAIPLAVAAGVAAVLLGSMGGVPSGAGGPTGRGSVAALEPLAVAGDRDAQRALEDTVLAPLTSDALLPAMGRDN